MPISQSIGTKRLASLTYDLPDSQSKYMKRAYTQKQARAIAAKISKRFPYADYGRAYFKRREPGSVQYNTFGATYKTADAQQRRNRKLAGYYGDGLYTGRGRFNFFKSVGRGFKKLGRALKPVAKEALNAGIHAGVGALMGGGLYTGRGAYVNTNVNTLISGSADAAMQVDGVGDETEAVIVTHREFIGDIYGPDSTAFNNQTYEINPGLSDVFPWLSQIAVNYEEYEFLQLVFEYKSTIDATSVTNGQTGTLIMASNYNLDNPAFQSKEDMMQYHGAMSGRLTEHMAHGVECDPSKNSGSAIKQVRNRPLDLTVQNIEDYDPARFEFGINNSPTIFKDQAIGELWVYYKIRLLKPRLGGNKGNCTQTAYFGAATGHTLTDPLGVNGGAFLSGLNSVAIDVDTPASNQTRFTFPAYYSGILRFIIKVEGTGWNVVSDSIMSTFNTGGNVYFMQNQYASRIGSGDNPANRALVMQDISNVCNAILVFDLKIKSSTGGTSNTITLIHSMNNGAITQSEINIIEIPDLARSTKDVRPKWFDSNGSRAELN